MIGRLRARLTLVCAVSTGLVLTAMALVSLNFSTRQLRSQYEESFHSDMNSVFFYLRGQNAIDHTWLAQTEKSSNLWIGIEFQGEPLFFTRQNETRELLTNLAAQLAYDEFSFNLRLPPSGTLQPDTVQFDMEYDGSSFRTAVSTLPAGQNRWFGVVILRSTQDEAQQIRNLRIAFGVAVVLALALLAAFAWLFSGWAVRPVEESHRRQTEFVSAASHELRSPLAVMQASAGAIQIAPIETARRFAATIERECDRLARLTEDLLRLAGADSNRWSMNPAPCDPQTLLLSAGERFELLTAQKNISLHTDLPNETLPQIRCDAQRIDQVLGILVDNAIRHTPSGGVIGLSAVRKRRHILFIVSDSGSGVPDEEKHRIFERFYRGDASRTDKENYGLGLSIAREIAAQHRGSLTVADAVGGGARFTLSLPI